MEIEDSYPLTSTQHGMLIHSLAAPQSGVYIQQMVCVFREELDVAALQRAWEKVVSRHAVLRTSFVWNNSGEPLQRIQRQIAVPFKYHDWKNLPFHTRPDRWKSFIQSDRRLGFQLNKAPLLRVVVVRWSQADYRMLWTSHHALLDGRSRLLVLNELFTLYEASRTGRSSSLHTPIPYRAYVDWLSKRDFDEGQHFWRDMLNGFTGPTRLTVNQGESSPAGISTFGRQSTQLTEDTTSELLCLSQKHQLTPNTFLQGAWALLLSCYSGEDDVVFGATRAGRQGTVGGAESIIGVFINTVPVRARVRFESQLLPWLKELRDLWIKVREFEHTPLVDIKRWSQIHPGNPLFETLLVFENYDLNTVMQKRDENRRRAFHVFGTTNYPIALAGRLASRLGLEITYDRGRFEDSTIRRILRNLQTLLEAMVSAPEQKIADLSLIPGSETRELLFDSNDMETISGKDKCIHELFEAQVERSPDSIALVFGEQELTYGELNRRANQLAHYLRKLGVKPETLVGICVERSLDMIVGVIGILKAGGAYVPLDPTYPRQRREFILQDAQATVLLTQEKLLPEISHPCIVCLDKEWERIAIEPDENPVRVTVADNLVYVIYTSGSTGKPKGVLITHRSLVNHTLAVASYCRIAPADRRSQFAALSFDVAAAELFSALANGARIVLRLDPWFDSFSDFHRFLDKEGLTVVSLPTGFWHEWVSYLSRSRAEVPASLRLVIVGTEQASAERLARWRKIVRDRIRWCNAYGPTEATITATIFDPMRSKKHRKLQTVPIGRPIANTEVYLLDRHLNPVPVGVRGEMYISGMGLGRGYVNGSELTAETFIPNPFKDRTGARLYKTGDLARYLPDGNIEFLGRIDHQVKIRGYRVELGEIEAVLRQHSALEEVAVIARDDSKAGHQLIAYFVTNQAATPASHALQSFLKEKLPEYMVPSLFVRIDAMPLNPSGKIDKKRLPVPEQSRSATEDAYVAPSTATEETLVAIWKEVLELDKVGIRDKFLDLGGHSLLATRVLARVFAICGVDLPLRTLFDNPTIESLATEVIRRQIGELKDDERLRLMADLKLFLDEKA